MTTNYIEATLLNRNNKTRSNLKFKVNDETLNAFTLHGIKLDIYIFDQLVILYAYNNKEDNIASANFETRLIPQGYKDAFRIITNKIIEYNKNQEPEGS